MPKIPEILFDDITIADKHIIAEYNHERCRMGLWSIYNVIKKIADNADIKLLECLLNIGVNASFKDDDMLCLVYTGRTSKKHKRGMPSAKYLFKLEKYGFVFDDLVAAKKDIAKNKLAVKDIVRFNFCYNNSDFSDVIFGLKLFSDICLKQSGDCFYTGDIRVAFINAPKLYAPPIDEVLYFLPDEQKAAAYIIHNKLEELGCVCNLEREYMTKYIHPLKKGQHFATIYASDELYFLPEFEREQKLAFKFNLRNINNYSDYLSECIDSVRQAIISTTDCYGCKKACGGIKFKYNEKTYAKCPFYSFRFNDLSEKAIENYVKLIELEDKVFNDYQ